MNQIKNLSHEKNILYRETKIHSKMALGDNYFTSNNLDMGCGSTNWLRHPFGNNPTSDTVLILIGLIFVLPIILFYKTILITEVRKDALYYKFFPFHRKFKKHTPKDIDSYEIRVYNPVGEYGGWGFRISRKKGKAYNVSGKIGMQLILKNGKKILFGTRNPDAFQKAMDKMMKGKDF